MKPFLFIPVTFWLLLPPGICVCRGFGNLLPFLNAQTITANTGAECEDSEHAPWCPVHKMKYLTDGGSPLEPSWDAGFLVALPLSVPLLGPNAGSLDAPKPTAHPADTPLYLNLRALRI